MVTASIKSESEMAKMAEGGRRLAKVKSRLREEVKEGVKASEIEDLAVRLIEEAKGRPSFKMVPNYSWATCVNVNEGLVHGIPSAEAVFKKGDVVSVDLGMYYQGFHTDTSFTVAIDGTARTEAFLETGRSALKKAIEVARPGNRIFDISLAIQESLEGDGVTPIRALTGHGIGRELHEEPAIPCFVNGERAKSPAINSPMALAIEVMYAQGRPEIELAQDGWTISMRDGKISALFEETVAISKHGPLVLTAG